MARKQALVCLLIGAATGTLGGLMGIGAGIVLVPALVGFLGLPQHKAQATSLAVIPLSGFFGAARYALQGYVNWTLLGVLAAGSSFGVMAGARFMTRVPARRLRQFFGILLLLVGLRMLIGQI